MAWFTVTSLMRTIELEFLQPNPRLVLDSTEAVEQLHGMLGQLLAFLEESENQFSGDDETKEDWKARVKDAALRIEDEIETQVIDIYGGGVPEHTRRPPPPLVERLLKSFQRAAGLDKWLLAKKFHTILQDAIEGIGELMVFVKRKQPMNDIVPSPRERIQRFDDGGSSSIGMALELQNTMVGHADELDDMKKLLLHDSFKRRQVVPIVGMGGIGKTTFARRLFEDPLVSSHFDIAAWTTVSAHYGMRRTLLELLSSIMPITEEINAKSNEELAVQLRKCLMGHRRYLIVLDDVWSTSSWDEIQRCFPDNNDGSRILLTCRLHEVASYTSSHNYFLNMRFLTSDESWQLFQQRVLNYGRFPANLESTWRHIVDYCQGLPFAIVLIAGLVQTTDESLWESKDFERTLYALVSYDLAEGISKILGLSYNHLPNFLKACFLYFGVFPENSVIHVKGLIRLWIAEGFVRVQSQKSLEEVAEDFLKDLVSRSLVLINNISLDGKIKTCKVHDIVHDFCRSKAIKENLLYVKNRYNTGYVGAYRWTSFETMYPQFNVLETFNRSRSLFCFYNDVGHMIRGHQLFANNFKMLRVLNLSSLSFMKDIPSHIVDLVLLRYLVLRPSKSLTTLRVSKNWNLQTLVLLANKQHKSEEANPLVSEIWELPKLRHVQVCTTFVLDAPSVVQQSLQTIYWLHSFQCTKQVFSRIPNAKVMGIFMEGSWEFGSNPNCLDNLRCLHKLEKLKIKSRHNPVLLPSLDAFPIHLKKLEFKGTLLPWNAMTVVVGMLPNLEVLKLKNGGCQGQDWTLSGGEFLGLKSLLIYETDLMHWTTTSDDFPVLERLILNGCYDLKAIPSSFGGVATLQLIELCHCYSSLVNCAKQIQDEQRDYGNDVLVVRNYSTRVIRSDL